jgi:hypothetical protein
MRRSGIPAPILFALSVLLVRAEAARFADPCFENLAYGFFVQKSVPVTGAQKDGVSRRLGVPLVRLSNTTLTAHGTFVQVNILEARSEEDAVRLFEVVSGMKGDPAFCLLRGRKVIEFCCRDPATAIKTAFELGLRPRPAWIRYRVAAEAAPVHEADYMALNPLFNLFLALDAGETSPETGARIRSLSDRVRFGDTLVLRSFGGREESSAYRFDPEPSRVERREGDRTAFVFENPPERRGIPFVSFQAEIVCGSRPGTKGRRNPPGRDLLRRTNFWPVDDPEVVRLARRIAGGEQSRAGKVRAVLRWLAPGTNLRIHGPTGSRFGVKKVFAQKFGHCWDFSDCFVTLARAAGVPARQVAGWLYGTGGHVWAEAWYDGGWRPVDPTGGGRLECGIYHIPYFITETGHMPILYVSLPCVEILETGGHRK